MLLGPQEPRFASWPEAHTRAAAAELCDFMASIGQPLDPWQRISLEIGCGERADGTWAAMEMALFVQRQNGKGGVFEARGLGGLFLFGTRLAYYTAHNLDTTRLSFARCVDLVTNYDDLRRRVARINKVNSQEAIEMIGGSELRFRTRGVGKGGSKGGKGRGFSCDDLFLDEALYLTAAAVEALMPTMLARPNPQIWYLSTPPEAADAKIMQILADGRAGVPGLGYAEWSNDPGADLNDQAVLAAANPAYGIRLNARVLEVLRRRLGEAGFARECGGIWPRPPGEQWLVIPQQAWRDRLDSQSRMDGRVALAVAMAPDRSWSAIGAAGRREDGDRHAEVVDHRPGSGWVVPRVLQLRERHDVCAVAVGAFGHEASLIVELEESGVEVLKMSAAQAAAAFGAFYDGVVPPEPGDEPEATQPASTLDVDQAAVDEVKLPRDRTPIWHLDQAPLLVALAGGSTRDLSGGKTWDWRATAVDLSPVRAVTNAVYAFAATAGQKRQVALEGALGV